MLRGLRGRYCFPIVLRFSPRFQTLAWGTKAIVGLGVVFVTLMHLCTCFLGASVRLAMENGDPSFISMLPAEYGVVPDLDQAAGLHGFRASRVYLWALYYSVSTFTSVGIFGSAHNDMEAMASIVVVIASCIGFALSLAVFSTLVSSKHWRLELESQRERSLQRYMKWRRLSKCHYETLKEVGRRLCSVAV